jgi:hypothetical protein
MEKKGEVTSCQVGLKVVVKKKFHVHNRPLVVGRSYLHVKNR